MTGSSAGHRVGAIGTGQVNFSLQVQVISVLLSASCGIFMWVQAVYFISKFTWNTYCDQMQ